MELWKMGTTADRDVVPPAGAVWIGSPHPFDLHEAYLSFRSRFELTGEGVNPTLFITADSRYKVWVNGRLAGRGPARSWPWAQSIDQIDLGPLLHSGENYLAVQVYQPGYSHFSYVHRGMAGLLAWVKVGPETALISNSSWRVRRDPSYRANVPRVSIYGSGIEERDMRAAQPWWRPNYDDRDWDTARIVARPFDAPWTGHKRRPVPILNEHRIPLKWVEARLGRYPTIANDDPHLTLAAAWRSGRRSAGISTAGEDDWVALELSKGETALWLFDLGRAYTCQGVIEVEGAAGGEKCAVTYADKMVDGEVVISDPETYCRVRMTDRFELRAGDQRCESFGLRGGRFLLFQIVGPTGKGFKIRQSAIAAAYPLNVSREFKSADPLLNQISQMCETTMIACLQDGFVDCVWRESSQWLGDGLPQSLTLRSMSDDLRPLRQLIIMAAEGGYPDGVLPSVSPAEVHAYTIVTYSLMWVELLTIYEQASGDTALVGELWPAVEKLIKGIFNHQHENGLFLSPLGRRFYVDWAPLSQNQPHAAFNLHVVRSLELAGELAQMLGHDKQATCWTERAGVLRQTIRHLFWRDGRWTDDLERSTYSQLTASLAILTGAARPDEWPSLCDDIVARSLNPSDDPIEGGMVLASPFMHHYLFEALRHTGREKAVIDIIKVRWGRWVDQGFPTTWENWNVDFPDGSQCHAFSAHPRYHLAEIGRVRPDLL